MGLHLVPDLAVDDGNVFAGVGDAFMAVRRYRRIVEQFVRDACRSAAVFVAGVFRDVQLQCQRGGRDDLRKS